MLLYRKALLCFSQENVRYSPLHFAYQTITCLKGPSGWSLRACPYRKRCAERARKIAASLSLSGPHRRVCVLSLVFTKCVKKNRAARHGNSDFWDWLNVRHAVFSRSGLPGGFGKLLATEWNIQRSSIRLDSLIPGVRRALPPAPAGLSLVMLLLLTGDHMPVSYITNGSGSIRL